MDTMKSAGLGLAASEPNPARTKRKALILIIGGLSLGMTMAALTVGLGGSEGSASAIDSIPEKIAIGQDAPDFAAPTPDGRLIRLSDLRGSPVAINFWATWCAPCKAEIPELEAARQRHAGDSLIILGVNAGEEGALVNSFLAELNAHFDSVLDPQMSIVDQYDIRAFPTTIWVDADGVTRAKHLGPLTREAIDQYVAELLARAAP